MEIKSILNNLNSSSIYAIFGNFNLSSSNNYSLVKYTYFKKTVIDYINSPKALKALQMVLLNESYLNKKANDLSINEIKKINLARALCSNKDYLILDYFDKELNYQEKNYFKRLFKKITTEYHKTIIIVTNDLNFIWDIAQEILVIKDNEVKTFTKNDFAILNYITKPEIIKFIDLLKAKNINISYYKETSDLLKAIYRLKE